MVRKVAAVHLMRWWQLFPKIFLYPYRLRTWLKSIFIVGVSWKITQITRMSAWLVFVRSEEDDLLGPRPSTLSWRNHLFWDFSSHLLLLRCIPICKWGLRPNIRIQAFALTSWMSYEMIRNFYFLFFNELLLNILFIFLTLLLFVLIFVVF